MKDCDNIIYGQIMKKNLPSIRTFSFIAIAAAISLVAMSILARNFTQKQMGYHQAKAGANICFQRITQTFTALMIRDFSSAYLETDFRNMTGDCLAEVSSVVSSLGTNKSLLNTVNNFKSDLHWFDQKVTKVMKMATEENMDISQSNITRKFSELEDLNNSLETGLLAASKSIDSDQYLALAGSILSFIAMALCGLGFYARRRLDLGELKAIEKAIAAQDKKFEVNTVVAKLTAYLHMPETAKMVREELEELKAENQRLEDSLLEMNRIDHQDVYKINADESTRSISDFSVSFNTVLDRLQARAFNEGIILDTDLNDDFRVYANQEVLEQLLLSLITFAMDSTQYLDENKRIIVRSKSLGGIAFCKVKISNYMFSDKELAILNNSSSEDNAEGNVNLLLLKELLKDASATMAVRHRQNSASSKVESEIELVFERAREDELSIPSSSPSQKIKVVKGNKKEIKDYLQAQL